MSDDPRVNELVKECIRQFDSCLYTGSALYIWQKWASFWRGIFLAAPVIFAGFSTSQLFTQDAWSTGKLFATFSGLLAGFFPAIYVSLNMDMRVAEIGRAASEFTNLRDRFRRAANVSKYSPYEEFKAEFEVLMDRMDAIRASAPPSPDWCFRKAQENIGKGDYDFDIDAKSPVPMP